METDAAPLTTDEIEAIALRIHRPIVLVGMMGVGKSSVGKRLAAALHCPFIDADRRVIARLIDNDDDRKVIATGGGAFCNPRTRALILERTIAVWLDSDIETLLERTSRKDDRPLLKQGDPREVLIRLRNERRPHYAQAPVHVMSCDGPHSRTVAKVLKGIEEWL